MKKVLSFMVIGIALLLSGCSLTQGHLAKNNAVTKTVYYQDLSKSDKKKVNFTFSLEQDETQDSKADPVYVVSMKVTNNSQKGIKFDKSKFIYLLPVDKTFSKKKGILTVQPKQTKTVNQLFEKIPAQGTLGGGIIEYLNKKNRLAYANFKHNKASSKNLSNSKLAKENKNVTGYYDQSSSSDDTTSSNDTTTDDESDELTEQEAKNILAESVNWVNNFGGYTYNTLAIRELDNGNWVFMNPDGYYWIVYPDGTVQKP